jgi:CelD/BcsL family acetyltransferase involved in cellulose biosynthesis
MQPYVAFPERGRMTHVEIVTDVARASALAPEWDALAVSAGQPLSSPAWMLAWWRHVAPRGAALRIVVVRDGDEVIGLLPLYREPGRRGPRGPHRLLADTLYASGPPLARAGRAEEVAQAALLALSRSARRPEPLALANVPAGSPWARTAQKRWPGRLRPLLVPYGRETVATVALDGSFADWTASRSPRFRRSMRRLLRNFDQAGGSFRLATTETATADIETFVRLHRARWDGRDESPLVGLGPRLPALLGDVAGSLLDSGRFRLWILELDGEPICADLSLAAGGEVIGYNSGWDERHRALSPPRLAFHHKIEDGFARGDRRLDLGSGALDHKGSFANAGDAVAWDMLVPISVGLPLTLARAVPLAGAGRLRLGLRRVLSPEQLQRVKSWR